MGTLSGRVAIVTGGGAGIGAAGARRFAQAGAAVVVVTAHAETAEATAASITRAGGRAIGVQADVRELSDVQAAVDAAIAWRGRVDVLWNNAGIVREVFTPVEEISVEAWHDVVSVNLHGVFHGLKCVIPPMKAQGYGRIVTTASIAGVVANRPGRAPYTAAKGAIEALTRLLALELAPFGIRVACLAPGVVRTPMTGAITPPADDPFGVAWEPPRSSPATDASRVAEADELAEAALSLVEDATGPLTGATVLHDAGRTAW